MNMKIIITKKSEPEFLVKFVVSNPSYSKPRELKAVGSIVCLKLKRASLISSIFGMMSKVATLIRIEKNMFVCPGNVRFKRGKYTSICIQFIMPHR